MKNKKQSKEFINIDQQHPYPGLYAFRETDSPYFYGREKETRDLEKLINSEVLTIVFGKSGVGKTSLLRAGLIPKLKYSYFLPVYLHIDFNNKETPPIAQTKETIESRIKEIDPGAMSFENLTLWEYFLSLEVLMGYVKPLLFFDQFEEMFTTGKDNPVHVNEFITEIADLVENRMPLPVREKLEREKKTFIYSKKETNFRVIISMREDYLPQLEPLYRYIPSIRFSRYRVAQMRGKDAMEAILKPGTDIIKDPDIGLQIIKKIPEAISADYRPYKNIEKSLYTKKIEPFLLSLFCYQVNEKRLEKKAGEISFDLIKDIRTEDIIKDYYEGNINRFKPNVKIAIEDLLLTEEGYRKLQDIHSFETGYQVTGKDIEGLVNRRIIRKETRAGIEYIELIHDVLAPILKASRDNRRQAEQREKELALRKKQYFRIIFAIISMATVFLALLTRYAFDQKTEADKLRIIAENQKAIAEREAQVTKAYGLAAHSTNLLEKDPTLSFRLAEAAYLRDKDNPAAYNALLNAYYRGGFYTLFKHKAPVKAAGFSPDGKYIITLDRDRAARCWDFTGKEIPAPPDGIPAIGPQSMDTSPGGREVIIARGPENTVRLQDLQGNIIRVFKGHTDEVNSVVFSPDGKYVVTAGSDQTARLWDLTFRENQPLVLAGHSSEQSDFFACFSREGRFVLTVNSQKLLLWNLQGTRASSPKIILLNPGYKPAAAFSPDGKYIAVAGPEDQRIRVLDLEGRLVREIAGHPNGANSVAFSPDSREIITAGNDGTARVWGLHTGKTRVFKGHDEDINTAVFSPDGRYILTASWDKTARLWNRAGKEIRKFTGHEKGVNSAVFSEDGANIVTAGSDGTARLWDLKGNEIRIFEGHTGAVKSAAFSPGGKYVITGSVDGTARLWDRKGTQVFKFQGFNAVIRTASFSADGTYILFAPARGPVRVRQAAPGAIIRSVNKRNVWQLDDAAKEKYNLII